MKYWANTAWGHKKSKYHKTTVTSALANTVPAVPAKSSTAGIQERRWCQRPRRKCSPWDVQPFVSSYPCQLPRCRWVFTPVLGASFPRSLTVIKDTLSFALLIVYTYLCNRWCLSVTLWAGLLNKKLSGRRETARCCFLLNISLSHSRSVKVIRNDTLENGVISY